MSIAKFKSCRICGFVSTTMMLLTQFGNMGRQLTNYNTELFAKRVMPQLTGLFENEWENRWWPRPLPAEERAAPRDAQL